MLIAIIVLLVVCFLLATCIVKAGQFKPDPRVAPAVTPRELSRESIDKLSRAIQVKTISYADTGAIELDRYQAFEALLEQDFPLVHKHMVKTSVGPFGFFYKWPGRNPDLKPILLLAHFDVVPPGDEHLWTHPPFSGFVDENNIWGRGAQDIKVALISTLEAAELLLAENFVPERTVYIATGGDEEIDGRHGAGKMAALLEEEGVALEFVLDEGGIISSGMISQCKAPVALVGIAEKGYLNLELTVQGKSGHAAMPPRHTALGILGAAMARIEKKPFPARMTGAVQQCFEHIAPYTSFFNRLIFANFWFSGGLLKIIFSKKPNTDAMIRTTQALTVAAGSQKENVLPESARAIVNIRILPGETIDSVVARVKQVVADPAIDIKPHPARIPNNPLTEAPVDAGGFKLIKATIRQLVDGVVVAPFLVTASTDSKHFRNLTDAIYRFTPVVFTAKDLEGIHGVDEKISFDNYNLCINFFKQLILNATGETN
jgi:carboxypeptidase PM20D1